MGDVSSPCIYRFPSVKLDKQPVRFIYYREPDEFYITKREKATDIPLFLGVDVLSGSSISSNNYSRTHERFSKQNLCSVLHLSGARIEGINHSNKLWFYSTQGLFRVAFEYFNTQAQRDCLECLKDIWIDTAHSSTLPGKINARPLLNEGAISEDIETNTQPLCIISHPEYCTHVSKQGKTSRKKQSLNSVSSDKADINIDTKGSPPHENETVSSSPKEEEYYILPLTDFDLANCADGDQNILKLDVVESRFEIVQDVATPGSSQAPTSIQDSTPEKHTLTNLEDTQKTCHVPPRGVDELEVGPENDYLDPKPGSHDLKTLMEYVTSVICERKQTLHLCQREAAMLDRLDVLCQFFTVEILSNSSEDQEEAGFPFEILDQYTKILSGNSKGIFDKDIYEFPPRRNVALCLISKWLGQKLHGISHVISTKVEEFKLQNIDQIHHLPSSQSLVEQLFPSCMVILLMNWMGKNYGETSSQYLQTTSDSDRDSTKVPPAKKKCTVDLANLSEIGGHGNMTKENEKQNVFPFVQLILEFVNNVLISGVAHVLYSRLLQGESC